MRKQVSKLALWGKSRAVIIPRHVCRELRWNVGDLMYVDVQQGCVVIALVPLPSVPTIVTNTKVGVAAE